MNYSKVFSQIIILFLIMIVGFIAKRKNIMNNEVSRGLTELVLNVTFPFMIIASFNFEYSKEMMNTGMIILGISFAAHLLLIAAGGILFRKYPQNLKGVLRFITVFSNCGFMGYPVINSIYGTVGVFYTAIYNIPFNIFMWTFGVMFFTGEKNTKDIKKVLLNPGIIAVFIGLILFIFSIKLPYVIYSTLDLIGATTTPLSMMIIGSMLADSDLKTIFSGFTVYYAALLRLVITPAVVFAILYLAGARGMLLGIPVLISGMPAAANTAIMAEKFNADSMFASKCIFITTLLSAVTIPLILLFL